MDKPLIIFDCDGVLVDSEPATNQVISNNLRNHGLELSVEQCIELFVGGSMVNVGEKAKQLGASIPDDWTDEIYDQIYARLKAGIDPIKDIQSVLVELQDKQIEFCVVSNGSEEKMAITLGGTNLLEYFEGKIFSAHTIGISKPDPGLFLHAAKTLGYEPQNCFVIEDSQSGVKAAVSAKMKCYGFDQHSDGQKLKSLGAIPFHAMKELPRLLEI